MKELAERSESEEIVAPEANCGITLLRRAILLLQISSWVQTGVWGEVSVGAGEAASGKSAMRLTQPARNCEWCAGGRANQTGFY